MADGSISGELFAVQHNRRKNKKNSVPGHTQDSPGQDMLSVGCLKKGGSLYGRLPPRYQLLLNVYLLFDEFNCLYGACLFHLQVVNAFADTLQGYGDAVIV
jgi:hypothetical protein